MKPKTTRSVSTAKSRGRIGVYTGSFDPVTLGHLHIIDRARRLFDQLVVGVGVNATKESTFTTEERVNLLEKVTRTWPEVKVAAFDGLAVDFVRQLGAATMVRGLRPLTDVAGEFTMMMANRRLAEEIDTVFLMADEEYAHVSSSLIKQIAAISDGAALEKFLPKAVIAPLLAKLKTTNDPKRR
jgi:pantetheine-phosphate adenylyltransferase